MQRSRVRRGFRQGEPASSFPAATAIIAASAAILCAFSAYDGAATLRRIAQLPTADAVKLSSLGSLVGGGGSRKSVVSPDAGAGSTKRVEGDGSGSCRLVGSGNDGDGESPETPPPPCYGVDRSFPVHYRPPAKVDDDGGDPFGDAPNRHVYEDFVGGCQRDATQTWEYLCDESEAARMESNLRLPSLMQNYTDAGFKKVRVPKKLHDALSEFWSANNPSSDYDLSTLPTDHELWNRGSTYVNHWSAPTRMLNIGDPDRGGGESLRTFIWDTARDALEEWTGLVGELMPSSLYGMRVFHNGAVMPPHVERSPFALTAVIHVDRNLDEPWPLEVYGHDGKAYNVTMDPGEMLLYEGQSVLHGRPFPMNGEFYTDVFVHFEPLGHTYQYEQQMQSDEAVEEKSLEYLYKQALSGASAATSKGSILSKTDLSVAPRYISKGSSEERRWIQAHPRTKMSASLKTSGSSKVSVTAHTAASIGDLDALQELDKRDPSAIKSVDENGWTPLHEAVRGGYTEVVEYLLGKGLDINQRTHDGKGGSPLWWAKQVHGKNHHMVKYLKEKGAESIKPAN